MGVWIETICGNVECMIEIVTPYVGVWIETVRTENLNPGKFVTPYVGVWIETKNDNQKVSPSEVTPYVGVWIETRGGKYGLFGARSLLMWECGLKLHPQKPSWKNTHVTPYVGVWIETGPTFNKTIRKICHSLCGSVD